MSTKEEGGSAASGLAFVAFLVLAALKLGGVVSMSWWWVTLPLWGGFALVMAILCAIGAAMLVALIVASVVELFSSIAKWGDS